ncbi:Retrovirus-related Pol polyprotein from transposon 412, partial [Frankliniella fusca]
TNRSDPDSSPHAAESEDSNYGSNIEGTNEFENVYDRQIVLAGHLPTCAVEDAPRIARIGTESNAGAEGEAQHMPAPQEGNFPGSKYFTVKLKESVFIPARCQTMFFVPIAARAGTECYVAPGESAMEKNLYNDFLVAHSIVQVSKNRTIPVMCVNPLPYEVEIEPDQYFIRVCALQPEQHDANLAPDHCSPACVSTSSSTHSSTNELVISNYFQDSGLESPPDEEFIEESYQTPLPTMQTPEQLISNADISHLPNKQQAKARKLLLKHSKLFDNSTLPCVTDYEAHIYLKDYTPIWVPQFRLPQVQVDFLQKEVLKMEERGIIEKSSAPFNFPCIITPKPRRNAHDPIQWRKVLDLRKLNGVVEVTCLAALPKVPDILESLSGKQYFTTLDLCSAFHTLPLAEDSRDFISFTVPGLGRYRYKRLHVPGATFHGPDGLSRLPISHQPSLAIVTRSGRNTDVPQPNTSTPKTNDIIANPLISHDDDPNDLPPESSDPATDWTPVYWNHLEMIDQQARDPLTGPIVRSLKGITNPQTAADKGDTPISRATLDKYFLDENGILRIKRPFNPIVVPAAVRPYIMALCHDSPLKGHFAAEQTYQVTSRQFYWRAMKLDIQTHVLNCITCNQFQRGSSRSVPMAKGLISTGFMELAAMDIVGPLKPDSRGHMYIFTFIDHWSRLLVAVPLKTITGEAVAKALIAHVFAKFGIPRRLLSDNGAQLVAGVLGALVAQLGIKQLRTMVYTPSHNAICERTHKDLIRVLATLVNTSQSNWGDQLFLATFCMNSHINKSTGETPFFLSTLRDAHFPTADMFLEQEPFRDTTRHDFVSDLYTEMRTLYRKIIDRQEAAAAARCATFNRKAMAKPVRAGMKCFLKVFAPPRHLSKKLYKKFDGPYRILKVIGSSAVEIQKIFPVDLKDAAVKRAHKNQIKLAPDTLLANGDIPPSIYPQWAQQEEDVDDPPPGSDIALRKGGPIVNAHTPATSATQPTLELGDKLDAGAIFVQEQVFHLSLAEWDVMIKLPKVKVFESHLKVLKNEAAKAFKDMQSKATKAELKNLLDIISVTEREMKNFETAAKRQRRQTTPYQPCSANSPSDRCAQTAIFLPVYQPPQRNKESLYAIRWLSTYYRKKEIQLASELLQNGVYRPADIFPKRWNDLLQAYFYRKDAQSTPSPTSTFVDKTLVNPLLRKPADLLKSPPLTTTTLNPIQQSLLPPTTTIRPLLTPRVNTDTKQPTRQHSQRPYELPSVLDVVPTQDPSETDTYRDPFAYDRLIRSVLNVEIGRNMADDNDIPLNDTDIEETRTSGRKLSRFAYAGFEWYISKGKSYLWMNGTCYGLPSTALASIMCPRTFRTFYAATIKNNFKHVTQPDIPRNNRKSLQHLNTEHQRVKRGVHCNGRTLPLSPLPQYIQDRFADEDKDTSLTWFAMYQNWLRTGLIEIQLCQELNETNTKLLNLAANTHNEVHGLETLLKDLMNLEADDGLRKRKDLRTLIQNSFQERTARLRRSVSNSNYSTYVYDVSNVRHSRPKRAVLDFLGNIANDIIGVMSARDRAALNTKMEALTNQTNVLTRLETEQASMLNLTLTALQQHETVLENLIALNKINMTAHVANVAEFASILRNMQAIVTLIRTEVNAFVGAYTLAKEDHVPAGLSLPIPAHIETIHYFYNTIKVFPSISNESFIMHMHIPLVHDNRKFTLFKAIPWPFKPNSTSDMFSYFQPEKEYIALHSDSTMHLLLDSAARQKCANADEIGICHPLTETYTNAFTCSYALLMSNSEEVQKHCTTMWTLRPRDRFVGLRHGMDWVFSLTQPSKVRVVDAAGRPFTTRPLTELPRTGVLHLPPGASAVVNQATLYAGALYSSMADDADTVVIPDISLQALQHLLDPIVMTPDAQNILKEALRESNNSLQLAGASSMDQRIRNAVASGRPNKAKITSPWRCPDLPLPMDEYLANSFLSRLNSKSFYDWTSPFSSCLRRIVPPDMTTLNIVSTTVK